MPTLVISLLPLLAHLAELAGWAHNDPLLIVSKLGLRTAGGILPGQAFIDGNALSTTLALGRLSAETWLGGGMPWWNPYVGVGLPLASEMQPASFFVPFILLLHFHSGVLFIKLSMQILAGLACYGLLRQMTVTSWAALCGAILFECNGFFAWYADAPILPLAFLPLLA